MCQSVPEGYGAPTLPPHQYPPGIKVFAGLVAVVALYGLFSTPHALMSLHQLRAASASMTAATSRAPRKPTKAC